MPYRPRDIAPRWYIGITVLTALSVLIISVDLTRLREKGDIRYDHPRIDHIMDSVNYIRLATPPLPRNETIDQIGESLFGNQGSGIMETISDWIRKMDPRHWFDVEESKLEINLRNYRGEYESMTNGTGSGQMAAALHHSLLKLRRDGYNLPHPKQKLKLAACRGEWLSFQLLLTAFETDIKDLAITIKGLPENCRIELFQAEYVYCPEALYPVKRTGWYADPLIPMEQTGSNGELHFRPTGYYPFNIQKSESKAIWFSLWVDENTPPGIHPIEIISQSKISGNKISQRNLLDMEVFDYTLPRRMHLKTAFGFEPRDEFFKYFFADTIITDSLEKEWFSMLLDYRITPTSIFASPSRPYPEMDDWPWLIERGAGPMCAGYIPLFDVDSIPYKQEKLYKDLLIESYHDIKNRGLEGHAYYYGFDESPVSHYYQITFWDEYLEEQGIDIPLASTVRACKELEGALDIWVPQTTWYNPDSAEAYLKPGDELWWYVCNYPVKPNYPNFFIEQAAIAPRVLFWQASRYGVDGFLYWSMARWLQNSYHKGIEKRHPAIWANHPELPALRSGKRWPELAWLVRPFPEYKFNGDGNLLYPGPDKQLLPCIRLIAIRDGIEDYEILYQLKKLAHEKEIAQFLKEEAYELAPTHTRYFNDPERFLQIRRKALGLLARYGNAD